MSLKDAIKPYGEQITTGMPDSILSGLYRTVLNDLGIEEVRFVNLVHRYIERTTAPSGAKELSSNKGNFRNELLKSVMTWKVFVKGLQVINVVNCRVGIQVWFNNPDQPTISVAKDMQLFTPKEHKELPRDDGFLSTMFGQLMLAMNMNQVKFQQLMALYIKRSHVQRNMVAISSARGNIKKELMNKKISWKVFIKGLVVLDVSHFVFRVDLTHRRGDITTHSRSIIIDQMPDQMSDDSDD